MSLLTNFFGTMPKPRKIGGVKGATVLDTTINLVSMESKRETAPDDQLFADCGLDSLDIVEIQMALEELYGVEVDWEEFWQPRRFDWALTMSYSATVKDLADFMESKIGV